LADEAVPVNDMDCADLEQRLKNAEEDLADAKTDEAAHKASVAAALLTDMLKVAR